MDSHDLTSRFVDEPSGFSDELFSDSNSVTYYYSLPFAPAPGGSAMPPVSPTSSQFVGPIGKKLPSFFHPEPWPRSARTSAATVLPRCPCPTNFGQTTGTGRSSIFPNYQHILESDRTSCR